jgi:hypothetical protein
VATATTSAAIRQSPTAGPSSSAASPPPSAPVASATPTPPACATTRERQDIETRLDALDARIGDVGYGGGNWNGNWQQTPRERLAAIERALPSLNRGEAADRIRVQLEDLTRLDAAYTRLTPSSDDRAYLDRRIGELEVQARIRR